MTVIAKKKALNNLLLILILVLNQYSKFFKLANFYKIKPIYKPSLIVQIKKDRFKFCIYYKD